MLEAELMDDLGLPTHMTAMESIGLSWLVSETNALAFVPLPREQYAFGSTLCILGQSPPMAQQNDHHTEAELMHRLFLLID